MKNFLLFVFLITLGVYIYVLSDSPKVSVTPASTGSNAIEGINSVTTENYANTNLEYYYYIPKSLIEKRIKEAPFLVAVPGLSGKGDAFVPPLFKDLAQREGFVIIAPSFMEDSANFDSGTSYQYPAAWSGDAFNKILDDITSKQKINYKGLYLFGLSAGAQFAERYSVLYPYKVSACFICAPGGVTLPDRAQKTKFVIAIGTNDEDVRKETAADFYNTAQRLGIDAQYKQYPIAHALSQDEINDAATFFRIVKNIQ